MKRIFKYIMLALPLAFMATACDDDKNEMPNVSISADISGGVEENGIIYIQQGQPLNINAITLVNNSGKEAALGAVTYYWDYQRVGTVVTRPFALTVETGDMPLGQHLLQAQMPIYVVDYPVVTGLFEINVVIVAPEEELPGGGDPSESVTFSGLVQRGE